MNCPKKPLVVLACLLALLLFACTSATAQVVGGSPTQTMTPSGPRIWLQENQPLPVQHVAGGQGTGVPVDLSGMGHAQPVSMTSSDLDADGFDDLVVGYSTGNGGYISIHRGNIDAFAPQSDASFQALGRGEFASPFQLEAKTFSVPVHPDFLALGNFTGQGNKDLAVATQGRNVLYIFPNDGKGNFGTPQKVNVGGGITALAAGALGHTEALIVGGAGSLSVYVSTPQGLTALASYTVSGPVTNIVFGDFGDGRESVAYLSGGKVQILSSATMQVTTVSLPVMVRAFALGSFIWDRNGGAQIALVAGDGSIQIAARNEFDPRVYTVPEFQAIRQARRNNQPLPGFYPARTFAGNGWKIVESFTGAATLGANQTPLIFRTRISIHGADDVMLLNAFSGQLTLISHADGQPGAQTFQSGQVSLRPYSGTPIAALPMRLNVDGRLGVMAIHQNEVAPSLMVPIPDPTFFVNTDNDPTPTSPIANACNNTGFADTSSSCSLREAVLKANGDTIMLQAGHTYSLTIGRGATQDYTGNTGALYVNNTATIVGGNQNTTIVQWGTPSTGTVDMVMAVNEDVTIISNATGSLSNLTIQKGTNNGTHGNDGDGGCMEFDTGGNGTANLTLTNVTIQNCATTQGNGGGLVTFNFIVPNGGGFPTITNSIIQNNSAVDTTAGVAAAGGGIGVSAQSRLVMSNSQVLNNNAVQNNTQHGTGGGMAIENQLASSPQTVIHSSTISGNKSAGFGGGIWDASNLLIDTGTVISGNIAGTDGTNPVAGQEGGGLYINTLPDGCPGACTDTATLTKVRITGNSATGNGGAISNGAGGTAPTAGPLTMSFSRLAGNSTSGSGSNLNNDGTTVTATNDWWGTNAASSTINTINGGTTSFDPFIVLTHTGSPDKIKINASSTLTGTMANDNHGNAVGLANLTEIIGLPITFDGAVLGTIPQAQPETLNASAQATATFNAGGTSGFGTANATVDQAVVAVNSNLIASATESGTTATITTVGAISFSTGDFVRISGVGVAGYNGSPATQEFKVLSTPTATSFTYTANTSGLGPSNGGTVNAGIIILEPPSITKSFSPKTIQTTAGTGTVVSTITFSITNANIVPINASFTDNLPSNVGTVPGNLVVASTPNVVNNCGGSVTATAGSGSISFTNAALAVGTCTIKVDVQSTVDNIYSNSVTINSTDAGNGNTASDTLNVINPPTSAKAFGAASIPLNGTTSLTITVSSTNQNQTLSGISFTDSLPAGLVVATPSGLSSTCSGTSTAAAGSGSVSLSGASLAPGASCNVSVNVQGTTAGVKNNSVSASDTIAGTGNTASASVTVVAPPSIAKAFSPNSIPLNGTSTLTFTITNPAANTVAETGVAFSDTLPTGLIVSTPNGLTNSCSGTVTATSGGTSISLAGGSIAVNSSCTVVVNVTGTTAGAFTNTSGAVSSTNGGTGNTATDTLTVVAPPSLAKAFNPNSIPLNGTSTLTFTITNPAANTVPESGVAFSDTLPTGLVVSTPNGLTNSCSGTASATAGGTSISLTGGTVAVNSSCTVVVNVTGGTAGAFTNTSGAVSSTNGGTGNTATDTLTVVAPPSLAKTFNPNSIPLNGTSTLTFTITNPAANTVAAAGVAFSDTLPTGLLVATPNGLTNSCSGTASASGTSISLTGGSIAVNSSCTLVVNVTGTTAGVFTNTSGAVSSTNGGTGNTASDTLTVVAPPSLAKTFNPNSIPLNGTSTLTFTITNPAANTVAAAGVAFSDALPAGLVVATPNGLTSTCGGTASAGPGGTSISLTGGSITVNSSCVLAVNVTGGTAGSFTNTSGAVSSTNGGTGNTATDTLTVVAPPSMAKAFNPTTIAVNGATTLTFTITNPAANTVAESGVAFSDTLPTGLVVSTPNGLTSTCGGTAIATSGSTGISLTGGSVAVNSTCTVAVNVTGTASGQYTNTSGAVSSTNGGTGNTASANLTVASPPSIAKAFNPKTVPLNGTSTLTFTIQNPNSGLALTGVAFSDTLPAGLLVATPNGLTSSCGGTASATSGSTSISLTGGSIAVSSSCMVAVNVTGTSAGQFTNTSGAVSSNEGGTGNTATDTLTVVAPPSMAKAFSPNSIPLNGTSTLTFTITNPAANTLAQSGVAFSDTLPAGLIVATPNGLTSSCGGTASATSGGASISLSGGAVAVNSSCTLVLNVTGGTAGSFTNTSGAVSSTNGGTGNTATDTLTVVAPPSIAKAFNPSSIPLNGTSTLTFTITNPAANTVAESGVAFSDTLPTGLVVATPNGLTSTCGGTTSATSGGTSISLSGGTVAVNSSCTVTVNVTGTASGQYTNTSGAVSSTNGGTGNTASANLTVASPPSISKSFGAATIPLSGTTSLTFNITNPNTITLTGIAFTDSLPAGLVVATPSNLSTSCGGTATAVSGSASVSLSGGTLAAGASCTVSVNVQGTTAGQKTNSVTVTSTGGGTGNTATASITVLAPPTISKGFGAASIPVGGSTSLSFTIQNPNTGNGLTGVGFSDALPSGLVVSTPNGLTGSCGGGTITATQGTGAISLSGGTLSANGSCTFSVNVTGTLAGTKNNTTSGVTSNEGGTGGTASASIIVIAPPAIAKAFNPSSIALSQTTSLGFTITNPAANPIALTGVGFTDVLQTGLTVANGSSAVCGGTLTTSGGNTISLSGATIAANSSCNFSVTVTPTAFGNYTNTTSNVTSNEGGTGNAAVASLTVFAVVTSPGSVNFGDVDSDHSATTTVTISNNGSAAVSLSISLTPGTGTSANNFTFSTTCPSSLAAHQSCTVTITFTAPHVTSASQLGVSTATLNVVSAGFTQHVPLSASVIDPEPQFTPGSLSFGHVVVNHSSTQTLTLKNVGLSALNITGFTITGNTPADFTFQNLCPASLAPGNSCTINVTFTPKATGNRDAKLNLIGNDEAEFVPIQGIGN